jgi:hypothetical protein
MATTAPETVIHAGWLLADPGAAPKRQQSIRISGDRIAAVSDGFIEPPSGARVIDLRAGSCCRG